MTDFSHQSHPGSKSVNAGVAARRAALDVLNDVVYHGTYLNLRLKEIHSSFSQSDAAFITALTSTTLERLISIDSIIAKYVSKKQKRVIQNLLRLAVCELICFHTPSYAVVSVYVNLSKNIGKGSLSGFINAVLRSIAKDKNEEQEKESPSVEDLSLRYSCPEWIVKMWVDAYGMKDTEALLSAPFSGVTVRIQHPYSEDDVLPLLPVPFVRGHHDPNALILSKGFDISGSELFQKGMITVQSEGAMLLCRFIGDCTGKKVLDACAAPGGKSAYLYSLTKGDINLTAMELHQHRTVLMQKNFHRLRVNADCRCSDATFFIPEYENLFDAVLIDAPCSGLGLMKEKPDIRYQKDPEDISSLKEIQKKLLDTCCRYVAPGGILLYATCTISKEENENQIADFLNRHPDFRPENIPEHSTSTLQLLPHIHGTDGFFAGRLRRCI